MWPYKTQDNADNKPKDVIENLLEEIYYELNEGISKRKETGRPINKPQLIPIALYYVAKSQKESAEIQKNLNKLTIGLIILTTILIGLTIILIINSV